MKVKQYNEMMAYLTRPGFNGGGSVRNKTVLPKRKPKAEIKRRQKINYEKIKQYLEDESQEFIERELGFAVGGRVNPAQLKQRFMQLVASIQDAEPEEIPGIVAQAKQIKDQIDEINLTLAPERQIKITSQGLDFDNPLLDAAKIEEAVMPTPEVTGGLTKDIVPESLTTGNPALKGAPEFKRGDEGTLADPREKEDLKPGLQVGVDPTGKFRQASMKINTGETFKRLKNIFDSIEQDPYPEIKTEDEFAEGGRIGFDRGGMAKMLEYLETLPEDTTVNIPELMDVAKKKRIKVSASTLSKMLTNIDVKQIAASGNETYQFGKERRDRVKNILKNVTIEKAPTGTPSGAQMTVKRRNKANKIAKILYERGDVSSPDYADIKFGSKDHNKIMARMNRKIIKQKDGTLDFKDESKKPLRSDQQAKLKKRFPDADFTKGRFGFKVDSPEEQYAKKYFKQGYKDSLRVGLTAKEIEDVKERFKKEIPKSEWNFLTKDNPKGFIYGLEGTGAGGKYEGMGNRIRGYLEGQPWFDKFAPGLNADRKNYLLTSFERVAQHEDKEIKKGNLKEKDRTYNRIKDKDGRIIGFKDNTPTGQGRKYFMTDMKLKVGNLSVTQHPQYAGTARLAKYVEATQGLMIGGSKFNNLVNNVMKVDPSTFGIMPFERHHIYGTAKDNFGGKPGEIMLLTRDQNRAVENGRKAYFRLPTSKAGPPISFEEADKQLKKIGAAIQLDGRVAGEVVPEAKTILQAARLAGIQKRTLIKAVEALPKDLQFKICNSLKSGGLPGDCAKAIEKNPVKTSDTVIQETSKVSPKIGGKALQAARFAKNIFGPAAIAGELGFEGLSIANKALETGMPLKTAYAESLINKYLAGEKTKIDLQAELEKEFAKGEDFAMAERGRRMAPFMARGEAAVDRRLREREEQMKQKFPGISEEDLTENVKTLYPGIDLSMFPMQDLKQQVDDAAKLEYFADNFRQEKAGGGIMKMAGKSSGPPPESGPSSQGLAFFEKNGIKR